MCWKRNEVFLSSPDDVRIFLPGLDNKLDVEESCWGFHSHRIERCYFWFDQIQDGDRDTTRHDRRYRQEPSDVAFAKLLWPLL